MRTQEQAREAVARELEDAVASAETGNEGRVRVCARRAAGTAISFWLQFHPRQGWSSDAVSQLRGLQDEESVSEEVRSAARRLSTRVTEKFIQPFTSDPISDARLIIDAMFSV